MASSSSDTIPYGSSDPFHDTGSESEPEPVSKTTKRKQQNTRGVKGRGVGGRGKVGTAVRGQSKRGRAGRGRSRLQLSDCERLSQLREHRSERLKNLIQELTEEEVRKTLLKVAEQSPGLVLHICNMVKPDDHEPPQPGPVHHGTPHWCVCDNCREMPTDQEKLCCGHDNAHCNNKQAEMDYLVLDPMVLALQQRYRNDVFALQSQTVEDVNKASRHAAYRQYILWQYNRLGEGHRRVIPSCCVWKIRDNFPDPFANYTGYIAGRLN